VSLRLRLALVAAFAVAAAVVFASVVVYFIVRSSLYGPIDAGLRTAATQIRLAPGTKPYRGKRPHQFILHADGFGSTTGFPLPFRLVANNGDTFLPDNAYSDSLGPLTATAHARAVASGSSKAYFFDAHVDGQAARIYTARFQVCCPVEYYAVQIAASLEAADHALARIRLWLIVVAISGIGVASVSGFLVAREALKPVRRLSATAEHVRLTQDLTQRIEVTGTDELSQLATTFNAMLASLDDAAQRQRQLVQDASHELRTPLTSLRTNIEVLASDGPMPAEDRRQLLADVVAQLTEMTALIGELTELARGDGQQTSLEEVRLDLVTAEAIRRTARNHPDVPIDSELSPTTAVGTPATLERAIANLLDNAAKWSPSGAHVDVRLQNGELSVRDRGPGISDSDLPHIFERFYRATSARSMPGSGLGLAIVKQVAEAHGGTVVAEHAPPPEGGTIMRFTIGNGNGAAHTERPGES
jgi:two-component system sensor histidine kinase MprB